MLAVAGFHPERQVDPKGKRPDLFHAAWMVQEAQQYVHQGKLEKANRWLGFIQGVFWVHRFRTIDEMRRDNMPAGEEYRPRDVKV